MPTKPTLLYNDECSVCRRIGHWVRKSAKGPAGEESLVVQPIGDDPAALHEISSSLNIWDAYETIHLIMPDGTMKLGGEAVAEVFRKLPSTMWFAGVFDIKVGRVRPFQVILNIGYVILSDVRPLFGCESCGTGNPLVTPFLHFKRWLKKRLAPQVVVHKSRHFTPLHAKK